MNDFKKIISGGLIDAARTLDAFSSEEKNIAAIATAARLIVDCIKEGGKVIACGNGGSMCDAMHFAEEMTGRFRDERNPFPAIAISDASHISCVANDYGYEHVFARYVAAVGNRGDVLLAISTSGNSSNVVLAARQAKEKNMRVIGLTGKNGGELASCCDAEIRAPESPYADRAQEIHIKVIHALISCAEAALS